MNNDELVQVSSIKIRIGDREIELSPEEARKLREVLNDILGPKAADPVYIPVPYPQQPLNPWVEPIWVNPNVEPWPNHWHVTCGPLRQGATLCVNA